MTKHSESCSGGPLFNPYAASFNSDPYPAYRRLRNEAPVHRSRLGVWVVSRHADVQYVLASKQFGKPGKAYLKMISEGRDDALFRDPTVVATTHWLESQNPPEHTRLRRLVLKALTSARIESMRPAIERCAIDLIERVQWQRRMDAIRDYAFPLATTTICELLGIPVEERSMFLSGHTIPNELLDPLPLSQEERHHARQRLEVIYGYFDDLVERRRRDPGDDLISQLLAVKDETGAPLTRDELLANLFLIFGAGHETTEHLIGNSLLWLHREPSLRRQLIHSPELIDSAVHELLRFDTSMQMTSRVALEDTVMGGVIIRKNERVLLLLGSANRDEAAYTDPDRIDFSRPQQPPLSSFGGGIHHCLGARLALVEAGIAIGAVLARLPRYVLEGDGGDQWLPTTNLHGLAMLPIRW